MIAAIASQGPDYAGEGREGIRTTDVLRAVRYLPRDHCPTERSLSTVVGRLNAWIIQDYNDGMGRKSDYPLLNGEVSVRFSFDGVHPDVQYRPEDCPFWQCVVVILEGCRVSRVPEPNSGGQEHCGLASSARFHLSSGVLFASSSPTCHSALKVSAPMIRDPSRPEAGVRVLSTWQDPRSAAGPRKRLKSTFPFSNYVFPLECVLHVSVVPFWPYLFYHPYHPLFLLL